MAASWTPCERSPTSSLLGQRVAAMRLRKSSIRSSEKSTWNGPIAAAVSTVVLITTSAFRETPPPDPTLSDPAGQSPTPDRYQTTGCHRLQPRPPIKAPSKLLFSDDAVHGFL